ncbi:LysR family transcriptional regulator [Paenibacillus zeisoli]|uniref:LysR family transcriptional regulator n=1 Tax=Paenibacillus zeisoli TaxID=2496267 RepID=A0A433XNW7_9BACL|nr:LysR family transcriptional regulator [Paenibacillus zeisoli]RUT35756.1 LysR family transcriptional regulator [Paenibacillus zeisoli]
MDFIYLQTFREVAIRQSFTRAAEALGYAQSSVTTQIQKLEKAYQVQLFERFSNNKIRLTSSGEELFRLAGQMLELLDQSREKMAKQGGGTMTIGSIDSIASYFLAPLIQATRQEYPQLNIRLHTDREESIVHQVKEGEADVGLILADGTNEPTLQWITIKEEPLVLIVNPKHPLVGRDRIELADLVNAEWIMPEHTCNYRQLLERLLRTNGINYRIGLELGNPEAIKRSIKTGNGISILPQMAAIEEIERGELKVLPIDNSELKLSIQLVIHPKKWVSNALRYFLENLKSFS